MKSNIQMLSIPLFSALFLLISNSIPHCAEKLPIPPLDYFLKFEEEDAINYFDYSRDGKYLLVDSDQQLIIYNTSNFQPIPQNRFLNGISQAVWTPNSQEILSLDLSLKVVNILSGEEYSKVNLQYVPLYRNPYVSANGTVFSPSGKYLAITLTYMSPRIEQFVRIYNWETGVLEDEFLAIPYMSCQVHFTLDEESVIVSSSSNGGGWNDRADMVDQVYLYNWKSKERKPLHLAPQDHLSRTFVFPNQPHLLVIWQNNITQLMDYQKDEIIQEFNFYDYVPGSAISYDVSPSERYMLVGSSANTAILLDLKTMKAIRELPSLRQTDVRVRFSPDGKQAVTRCLLYYLQVWNMSDLYPEPEVPETATALPTPRPPRPTWTPTRILTPIITPTITPNPRPVSTFSVSNLHSEFLSYYNEYAPALAVDPRNQDLYVFRAVDDQRPLICGPMPYNQTWLDTSQLPIYAELPNQIIGNQESRGFSIDPRGVQYIYFGGTVYRIPEKGVVQPIYPLTSESTDVMDMYLVGKNDTIPGSQAGDLILLSPPESREGKTQFHITRIDPHSAPGTDRIILSTEIGEEPKSMTVGPGGYLYLSALGKTEIQGLLYPTFALYRLEMNFSLTKVYQSEIFRDTADNLAYWPKDGAFYFYANSVGNLWRLDPNTSASTLIFDRGRERLFDIALYDHGEKMLWMDRTTDRRISVKHIQSVSLLRPFDTPTPGGRIQSFPTPLPTETPSATPTPSPTPSPVLGWFVLDGFGGIHSTNPNIGRPNLPYLGGFNIMRDLEPDPLGRGWYMLDGFGGIHTSSPDLSVPRSLPYFDGFDIARNLEVKQKGERLEFYLLDGFGAVHTTDPDFQYGQLPWFGFDIAQDLVTVPQQNEWRVLDRFGALHSSQDSALSLPLGNVFQIPVVKSIVPFPDGTALLLDAFGGRHTDPSHPTADVLQGLPSEFYFPGWEIVQDVEVVPENRE